MKKDQTLLPRDLQLERDESEDVYRVHHDWTDEPPSTVVVAAVATVSKTDPLELEPLRDSLDPDALDDVFAPTHGGRSRTSGFVEFSFADHHVVVDGSGEIEIRPENRS